MNNIHRDRNFLSSRLLTFQTPNPEDNIPLTPNHFLYGHQCETFAPTSVDETQYSAMDPRAFTNTWIARKKKGTNRKEILQLVHLCLEVHLEVHGHLGESQKYTLGKMVMLMPIKLYPMKTNMLDQ